MTRYARLKKDYKELPAGLIVSVDRWISFTAKPNRILYLLTFGMCNVILKQAKVNDLLEFLDEAPTE